MKIKNKLQAMLILLIILTSVSITSEVVTTVREYRPDTVYVKNILVTIPHPDYEQKVNLIKAKGYPISVYDSGNQDNGKTTVLIGNYNKQ